MFRSFFFRKSLLHSSYNKQTASSRPSRDKASPTARDTFEVASGWPRIRWLMRAVRALMDSPSVSDDMLCDVCADSVH